MKKIKLYYEKFIELLQRVEDFVNGNRLIRSLIIIIFDLFYLFVLIETFSWSIDLLNESFDAVNIVTVVLAFHVINVVLTPALYKE